MSLRLAAIVLLCAAIGISLVLSVRSLRANVSAQDLLREAVRDGGPVEDIFAQQAGQGYYDDALATARLATANLRDRDYELSGWIEKLIEIRAENGDIHGAKNMAQQFTGSVLRGEEHKVMLEIAEIQVDAGDLQRALETGTSADRDKVMEYFGARQIANGDFDGALKTAQQVSDRSAYDLFYDLGSALRDRGEQKRLPELAARMTDRKRAAECVEAARFTLYLESEVVRTQATPCDIADYDATIGKFAEAWALFDKNNCRNSSFIAVNEYATNPAKAEGELLKRGDKVELTTGLSEMAKSSAKRGDVSNALHLVDTGRRATGDRNFCLDCIRLIGWARALKGQPKESLRWARSLPVTEQRGFALLGVAQALAHPKPK